MKMSLIIYEDESQSEESVKAYNNSTKRVSNIFPFKKDNRHVTHYM